MRVTLDMLCVLSLVLGIDVYVPYLKKMQEEKRRRGFEKTWPVWSEQKSEI